MIGIYKITNKINGRVYVGQSNDIERRWKEHCRHNKQLIDRAIQKYGKDNFLFEIIEEIPKGVNINQREEFWIGYYNCIAPNGYNIMNSVNTMGENNGNSLLTNEDIIFIRQCYKNKVYKTGKELWEKHYSTFSQDYIVKIFYGGGWNHILMDVYTDELAEYYKEQQKHFGYRKPGENNPAAIVKEKDVIMMRQMYVEHDRNYIFKQFPSYSQRTIVSILTGQNWKHLPIYKKREKRWIYPQE